MISTKYLKAVERFSQDNSPAILAGIAVVGTVATAYLAAKASFQAERKLNSEVRTASEFYNRDLELRDEVKAVWKLYIPAASTGILTITCIVGSSTIGNRRTAAMAAAYTISERAYSEYRDKIVEKIGEKREQTARDDIARDRVSRTPSSGVVVVGDGSVLCFDQHSGRYFESTMESIKKAVNDTNYEILHSNYASLADFYHRIELVPTKYAEDVGWNTDHLVDLTFSTVLTDDMKPCLAIDFSVVPVRHFYRIGTS